MFLVLLVYKYLDSDNNLKIQEKQMEWRMKEMVGQIKGGELDCKKIMKHSSEVMWITNRNLSCNRNP
jgi:hypothetical protein